MLRHIGCSLSPSDIKAALDEAGLQSTFHFISVPRVPAGPANPGYAFVCFRSFASAEECRRLFDGKQFGNTRSEKICQVTFAAEERSVEETYSKCQRRLGKTSGIMMLDEHGEPYAMTKGQVEEWNAPASAADPRPSVETAGAPESDEQACPGPATSSDGGWEARPTVAKWSRAGAPCTKTWRVKEEVASLQQDPPPPPHRRVRVSAEGAPRSVATAECVPSHLSWLFPGRALQTPSAERAPWPHRPDVRPTWSTPYSAEQWSGWLAPHPVMQYHEANIDDILDDIVSGCSAADAGVPPELPWPRVWSV